MSKNKKERSKVQDEPLSLQLEVKCAMAPSGVLALAVRTVPDWRRLADQQTGIDRRVETEADIIEGDVPFFI